MGIRRFFAIVAVFLRYRLDQFIDTSKLPWYAALALKLGPWRLLPNRAKAFSRGERLRLALESLGPIFIKFGQLLSTRRDLLPPDIADEMALLQDQVPPFCGEEATAQVERALGCSVDEVFAHFERSPMASASIAQVHAATLKTGESVVVKVLRPNIRKPIDQDLALMFGLAGLAERYLPEGKRLHPTEVVEDYKHTILDELDLLREAANTTQLRRNFDNSPLLYVPEVHWDYCRRDVMVMERIDGIPVTNINELEAQNTNMKMLAERGVEIFFTQVFRDSFFHADMHPGNVFVSRKNPGEPQYIGIDCAIIGTLSEADQYYLARNLLAIFRRNYREVAELHIECGWIAPHSKPTEFEAAIRSVCEPIFEKPLSDISFGHLLVQLFQVARRFEMEVQPSLVLLQKTLLNVEGLGRQLYPQLDLWNTAMPFLERWIRDRYAPQNVLKKVGDKLPGLLEQLPQLPDLILEQARNGDIGQPRKPDPQLARLEEQLVKAEQSRRRMMLAGLLAITGLLMSNPALMGESVTPQFGWGLLAAAGLLLALRR